MAWRNSPAITRPTWTAAAEACWIFDRCFGKTVGPSAGTIFGAARLRFSPNGAALRLSWRWISYAWPDAAGVSEADGAVLAPLRALLLLLALLPPPLPFSRFRASGSTTCYR